MTARDARFPSGVPVVSIRAILSKPCPVTLGGKTRSIRAVFQRLADGVFAIAGAAGLSQFPEYYRQYLQRIGGRLDQALVQEGRIAAAAREHGLAVSDYVQRLLSNTDPVARSEGANVSAALADVERLRVAHDALRAAGPFERPVAFARHFDESIARSTLDQFVPAVPISPEGLAYAAVGMLVGLLLLAGGQRGARATARGLRRRRASP